MKKAFLIKLKKTKKLSLVEQSEETSFSYAHKSEECLQSSLLLLKNRLNEPAITLLYYAMYNSLLSLLFLVGIKCENHAAAINLFCLFFDAHERCEQLLIAKKARIDSQYYVSDNKDSLKERVSSLFIVAENFVNDMENERTNLKKETIEKIRDYVEAL